MKNLKLFLLPLLLLLSGGFTATQQTVLFSGGCPTIGGACPSINLNFTTGKYWVNGVGFVPLTSVVSTTRASSKICANAAGVLTSVGNNILCVTDQGALIEEARTNSIPYSQAAFATQWIANAGALTDTSTSAPDLTNTASTFTAGAGAAQYYFFPNATSSYTSASVYTISIFVKAGTQYLIQLTASSSAFGGLGYINADLSTGTIVGSGGTIVSSGISASVNGWYRIYLTVTATASVSAAGPTITPIASASSTRVPSITGSSKTFFVWGAQSELGPFVTSPIVTAGASATRAADVPQLIGPAATAALAAKSAFVQTFGYAGGTQPYLFDIENASVSRLAINTGGAAGLISSGVNNISANPGSGTYAGIAKMAGGFDSSSMTLVVNGGTKATSANPWVNTAATVYIGNAGAGTRALNGYMQDFALQNNKGVFDASTTP